ncbi:UDP-N-acetylmuramoyl-L-alanine--D-glutamate ligase [Agarilytica rhodophyticola]|uniref:UDP-N-acetylmuramoyl-L-alanine--D-glutamate ligase n=1 Tax=Agarilytica rhodophyticola TaxID=1737490 RepID=UPI001FEBFD51|nr:UDP-N-acetylmuramoyl-L-alanine--D-glutamate ligase [Agarilytica rhodophyticola]
MNQTVNNKRYALIVGMGATGYSIARYLQNKGEAFHIVDTRTSSLMEEQFAKAFPEAQRYFVEIDEGIIAGAHEIYLSPGVSRDEHIITKALALGKSVIGDIELFLRAVDKPVIGITGSNGKSTVTTLVGLMLKEDGRNVAVGGNIGTPALELLNTQADIYVLELSSFQLESVTKPNLFIACNLNISADHMDRYDSISAYVMAKQKIFLGAKNAIYNLDDPLTHPPVFDGMMRYGFGLESGFADDEKHIIFSPQNGWLSFDHQKIVSKDQIKLKGIHNVRNALAALAISGVAGVSFDACKNVLAAFSGLPHRCEFIAEYEGVTYINDSKATNVGATKAAIDGLAAEFNKIILIAGGEGKGADFSELGKSIRQNIDTLVLIGKDGEHIAETVGKDINAIFASDMNDAVQKAATNAGLDDLVLLSPACASFDMFNSFEERGDVFSDCVHTLTERCV